MTFSVAGAGLEREQTAPSESSKSTLRYVEYGTELRLLFRLCRGVYKPTRTGKSLLHLPRQRLQPSRCRIKTNRGGRYTRSMSSDTPFVRTTHLKRLLVTCVSVRFGGGGRCLEQISRSRRHEWENRRRRRPLLSRLVSTDGVCRGLSVVGVWQPTKSFERNKMEPNTMELSRRSQCGWCDKQGWSMKLYIDDKRPYNSVY